MRAFFTSIFSFALLTASCLGEEFTIKFERTIKVGDKLRMHGEANESSRFDLKVDGAPVPAPPGSLEDVRYDIDCAIECVAVDASGRVEKLKGDLKTLKSVQKGDSEVEVLPEGSGIEMVFGDDGKESFTVGGKPATEAAVKALGEFFDSSRGDDEDTDTVFGTDEKMEVGGTWRLDSKAASAALAKQGIKVAPKQLSGEFKLHAIVERDGVRCLDIRGEVLMGFVEIPMPEGVKVT